MAGKGYYGEAEVLVVHVMDMSLKTFGEQDPFTLDSMVNLAVQ